MSQLQLSNQVIETVQQALIAHDPQASDPGVTAQYLAAMTGFLIGQQSALSSERKKELLEHLAEFSIHVMQDIDNQSAPTAPTEDAFGVWKAQQD